MVTVFSGMKQKYNKLYYAGIVAAVLLTSVLAVPAYGQTVVTIDTTQQVYGDSERVEYNGTYSPVIPGEIAYVSIIAPNGTNIGTNLHYIYDTSDGTVSGGVWNLYFEDNHGEYTAEIQYMNSTDTTTFSIVQSVLDEVQIPPWIKQLAQHWTQGSISDKEFATAIQYLIQQGIIQI